MRKHQSIVSMRTLSRILVVAVIGGAAAACGPDVARMNENPLPNPFGKSERFAEKSPQTATAQATPAPAMPPASSGPGSVTSAPLAPPSVSSAPLAPPVAAPAPAPTRNATAASTAPASGGGWTAQGGSIVTLGQGETLRTLAGRYGVPESALRQTNNLAGSSQPALGQKVVIPVFNAAPAAAPRVAPATAPARAPGQSDVQSQPQQAAAAGRTQQPAAAPAQAQPQSRQQTAAAQPVAPVQTKPAEPAKPADPKAAAKPAAEPARTAAPETTAAIAPATTEFRWPVRGRVITGFGNKPGQQMDGISIAVPEGTPVKAAESGVVGYAGNELKGYGNLVLIRHDNGMVTVYAHNGELKVKRGEQVRRGQVIATSGQTGNVSSPQLKFEIRKGQTPVDPLEYLSGN